MREENLTPIEIESKRFAGNVGVCWHAPTQNNKLQRHCQTCGIQACDNPTYTIELIRAELERVGKWEGFKLWVWGHFDTGEDPEWDDELLETMTTPLLFLQAANSYLEQEREDAAYQTQQVMEDR